MSGLYIFYDLVKVPQFKYNLADFTIYTIFMYFTIFLYCVGLYIFYVFYDFNKVDIILSMPTPEPPNILAKIPASLSKNLYYHIYFNDERKEWHASKHLVIFSIEILFSFGGYEQ